MTRFKTASGAALLALACAAPAMANTSAHGQGDPAKAVKVYHHDASPLAHVGGQDVGGSAFGSSFVAKPGSNNVFYGLTDRGPNVDAPDGGKVEPIPTFQPAIGEFKLVGDRMVLQRRIGLSAKDGHPLNGQVSPEADTGETIYSIDGKPLPASPYGYDPEGLVAMPDGSFWVSDEYGPYVTHFDATGREIERLSPFNGALDAELKNREPNKGMEGLTLSADGKQLVGIMQAALNAPDGPKSKKVSALRIVTIDLASRATKQYIYMLHNTDGADTTVSEIAALPNGDFLVDERDGKLEPNANKKLFRISLKDATNVGSTSALKGATYDSAKGGLLINGKTIEAIAGKDATEKATASLEEAGVTPVSSSLFLDVAGLISAISPDGSFFGHDKIEGVAVTKGGNEIYLSNDSDFGIDGLTGDDAPWQLQPKRLPNGTVDSGEVLRIDMKKVPNAFKG